MKVGVFAMQGAVDLHLQKLRAMGLEGLPVGNAKELHSCSGLILPGGESSTLLKLIDIFQLEEDICAFAQEKPLWGICAGAILVAEKVEKPPQKCFSLFPVNLERNVYGRQNESFIHPIDIKLNGKQQTVEGVFIRAPGITQCNSQEVEVLATHKERPVALQYKHHMLTTFHPELTASFALHQYFLDLCKKKEKEREKSP